MQRKTSHLLLTLTPLLLAAASAVALADGRALTLQELMQFRTLHDVVVSDDGAWIAYTSRPDRGDGEAVVRATAGDTEYRIERGKAPHLAAAHAVALVEPSLAEQEKAKTAKQKDAKKDDKPKTGLAVVALADGAQEDVERVESFAVSEDGRWLAYKLFKDEEKKDAKKDDDKEEGATEEPAAEEPAAEEPAAEEPAAEEENAAEGDDEKPKKDKKPGTRLVLRDLSSGEAQTLENVETYSFDEPSTVLVYTVRTEDGEGNGLFVRRLSNASEAEAVAENVKGRYSHLTWARQKTRLAFVAADVDEDLEPQDAVLHAWDGAEIRRVASSDDAPEGFELPFTNPLDWSRGGERLFFGWKSVDPEDAKDKDGEDGEDDEEAAFDPYDLDALVEDRELAVWHWNDPLIQTHQEKQWKTEKDRTYKAVYHWDGGGIVHLADLEARNLRVPAHGTRALLEADTPYLREITWDGNYADVHLVDLVTGERQLVTKHQQGFRSLSPDGRWVVYFRDADWHLYDAESRETRNLTKDLGVPFANEDHDYPMAVPGYRMADWVRDSSAVLIYDKYDVWQFPTDGSAPICLTGGEGRKEERVYRVVDLEPKEEGVEPGARLLLDGYHDKKKQDGFFAARVGKTGVDQLYEPGAYLLNVIAKAEDADRVVFTRESYNEFPDLWLSDLSLSKPEKLSKANPQIADYAWGSSELVEWTSLDGIPLQGALIKPGNYEEGKRYPVLVYFYRFFSQRLNEFNEPVVNHRPSFPFYASNGYAVFLPDVRFEVGRPGFSATKCLVPGVQKLVDLGVADPDAIGLHGHSWSGYQAAFVITQTKIFKAAVAGAPVSNMTSAYSGIRWGTGLARQFQYEKSQSRLGGSLWEVPERYIENSPVFFADKIRTPLLIEFGDEDGAVPWYQGIELYLACRRLDKDCIFLQYRGEPHHLKKYPNKVDYSIKMKEFFDHHLKGAPAPKWMTEGVPYRGKDD